MRVNVGWGLYVIGVGCLAVAADSLQSSLVIIGVACLFAALAKGLAWLADLT